MTTKRKYVMYIAKKKKIYLNKVSMHINTISLHYVLINIQQQWLLQCLRNPDSYIYI